MTGVQTCALPISDLTCVDGGPIPSFLSGCFVGNGGNGIGPDSYLKKKVW